MYRPRTNHLLKIEKENENKDIKVRQKTVPSKATPNVPSTRHGAPKQSSSMTIETASSSQQLGQANSASTNPNVETDNNVKSIGMFPNHKRLGPYMPPTPGPKPRIGQRSTKPPPPPAALKKSALTSPATGDKTPLTAKSLNNTDRDRHSSETIVPCITIKESLKPISARSNVSRDTWNTPRSGRLELISLKSRREGISTCSGSSTYLNLDLDIVSLGPPSSDRDSYYMAPLIPVPSVNPSNSSDSGVSMERKIREALDRSKNFMEDDEINLVKNIIKTDQRYTLFRKKNVNPKMFSDVLKTQLYNIEQNEKVIKSALVKLELPQKIEEEKTVKNENINYENEKVMRRAKKRKLSVGSDNSSDDGYTDQRQEIFFKKENISAINDNRAEKSMDRCYEKRYLYSRNVEDNIFRNEDAQKEYNEFLKSSGPSKQKAIQRKESGLVVVARSPTQVNMQLDLQDFSDVLDTQKSSKRDQRPQVNVVFKNVPSLEKEILILRALGDRLESAYSRTAVAKDPSSSDAVQKLDQFSTANSHTSLTRELHKIDSSIKIYPGRQYPQRNVSTLSLTNMQIPWKPKKVGNLEFAFGLRHEIGIVNEFIIVAKTINELRSDAASNFYISERGQLFCTSFEDLKKEPDFLMKLLKPKSPEKPFNLLDQDPIFFNSLIRPIFENEMKDKVKRSYKKKTMPKTMTEGGDSLVTVTEEIKTIHTKTQSKDGSRPKTKMEIKKKKSEEMEIRNTKPQRSESKKSVKSPKPETPCCSLESIATTAPVVSVRRSHIRQQVTPMPFDAFVDPKTHLLKISLIGVIQVALFLGMILALSLPDIKC